MFLREVLANTAFSMAHPLLFARDVIFQRNTNDCENSLFDFIIWLNSFLLLLEFALKDKILNTIEYETLD